jgi:hypothetical protein
MAGVAPIPAIGVEDVYELRKIGSLGTPIDFKPSLGHNRTDPQAHWRSKEMAEKMAPRRRQDAAHETHHPGDPELSPPCSPTKVG